MLDETMYGKSMALYVINKTNNMLKSLNQENRYLFPILRRLLCNVLIQPHSNYPCFAW